MDHPLLALGGEEHVPPLGPCSVEHDDDLVVAPLLALVGPLVPDGDGPAAVLAGRDGAAEGQVFERVVLGVHRQMVGAGIER